MEMKRKRRSLQRRKIPKRTKIWAGDQQEPGSTSATGECGSAGVQGMVMDNMMCGQSFRGYRVKPKQKCLKTTIFLLTSKGKDKSAEEVNMNFLQ